MKRGETIIGTEYIICGRCSYRFERDKPNKHCSNCFACTGCETYYCPSCDHEIIITPRKPIGNSEGSGKKGKDGPPV